MATINTIVVSGRLTADPELRYTQSGTAVANGSIAVTDGYGDNEKTCFFNWEAWKHTAEYLANYAKKGMPVTLAGKLLQQTWEDTNGNKRQKVFIRINEAILPPKGAGNGNSGNGAGGSSGSGHNSSSGDNPYEGLGQEIVFDDNELPF